jgi:HPt (histidine-containing phosphotransfer) domain-containing protein
MNDPQEALRLQLDQLKRNYRADLRDHVGEIIAGWSQTRLAAEVGPGLDRLRDLTHRLAGTSGIFGLREVSRTAFEMENLLDKHNDALPLSDAELQALDKLVAVLRDLAISCCDA